MEQDNFIVAVSPQAALPDIMLHYRRMGAFDIGFLSNISRVLKLNILAVAMPPGFPEVRLHVSGVVQVDSEVEHGFFGLMPGMDPLPPNLRRDAPLGRFDLTLGSPSSGQAFAHQGGLDTLLDMVQAPQAWQNNRGAGATILVIDTGIDGHRVPVQKRAGGWVDPSIGGDPWTDDYGHGTMVGLIAAGSKAHNGFDGVAPDAKLFSLKPGLGDSGGVLGTSVMKGLDHVLGLSLGPLVTNHSWGVFGCNSPLASCTVLAAQLVKAISKGALTVWAAGNNKNSCGPASAGTLWCMNSLPEAVSVGAVDRALQPQFYSSPGPGQ